MQDPHAEEFEDKEWTFVIENVSTKLFSQSFNCCLYQRCLFQINQPVNDNDLMIFLWVILFLACIFHAHPLYTCSVCHLVVGRCNYSVDVPETHVPWQTGVDAKTELIIKKPELSLKMTSALFNNLLMLLQHINQGYISAAKLM